MILELLSLHGTCFRGATNDQKAYSGFILSSSEQVLSNVDQSHADCKYDVELMKFNPLEAAQRALDLRYKLGVSVRHSFAIFHTSRPLSFGTTQ